MEHTPALKALGIQPVGLSVDAPENARLTKEALNVPFPLLSDPDLLAHKAFRVLNKLDDETVAKYDAWNLDVERWSGRQHHVVAIPGIFLVDENRMVRFAHADRDYKTRPDIGQIIETIKPILSK